MRPLPFEIKGGGEDGRVVFFQFFQNFRDKAVCIVARPFVDFIDRLGVRKILAADFGVESLFHVICEIVAQLDDFLINPDTVGGGQLYLPFVRLQNVTVQRGVIAGGGIQFAAIHAIKRLRQLFARFAVRALGGHRNRGHGVIGGDDKVIRLVCLMTPDRFGKGQRQTNNVFHFGAVMRAVFWFLLAGLAGHGRITPSDKNIKNGNAGVRAGCSTQA